MPWLGAGRPLEVVPPSEIDDVTGLPLVVCPRCKDLRLIAFTCKWTKNRGKRFFKCPRNNDWAVNRCGIIMVQSQYENYLQGKNDVLPALMVEATPPQLIEEIKQVKMECSEMKEELAMVKLGIVVFSAVCVVICIVWFALK
ncbi:unnamed protein product [Urochloa humidicola]